MLQFKKYWNTKQLKLVKEFIANSSFTQLFFKLFLVLFFLLLYRVVFLIQNGQFFPNFKISDYLVGSWFDMITIALYYIPFIGIYILPIPEIYVRWKNIAENVIFSLTTFVIYFFNGMDIAYFSYTRKRVSYDYFKFMLGEDNSGNLMGDFLGEFWWLLIFLFITFGLTIYLYHLIQRRVLNYKSVWLYPKILITIFLTVVIGRGGFQLKPVGILEATNYSSLENAPAVLNSAFTMLKTFNNVGLEEKKYFSQAEADQIFNPHQISHPQSFFQSKQNVVVVILESFGSMYVGPNNPESYTPFLDSLFREGMYFEYGVSNSKTSMDAMPAVISSIPTWMNESFILSSYSMNQFEGLPSILDQHGYSSAFFHGANNGSMRFDAFANATGFHAYYGRDEYGNDDHFDQKWGISDHYFLSYAVDVMENMSKPFFSSIFTISSHHPFSVPSGFESKVKHGPDPICATLSYVDLALKMFMDKAKTKAWYDNTLFVFCADHVGPTKRSDRYSIEWSHRIPIGFYHSSMKLPKIGKGETLQQIDIMPTIIDILGIDQKYFAMGNSYFNPKKQPTLIFDQENLVNISPNHSPIIWNEASNKNWNNEEKEIIRHLKAIYQQYTHALIHNKMKND